VKIAYKDFGAIIKSLDKALLDTVLNHPVFTGFIEKYACKDELFDIILDIVEGYIDMSRLLKKKIDTLLFLASGKSEGVTGLADELKVNKSAAFRMMRKKIGRVVPLMIKPAKSIVIGRGGAFYEKRA